MAIHKSTNGPFIFTMASLISESLQICYFPFPPQANGALKPHGTNLLPPHLPPGGRTLPYLPSRPGKLTWQRQGGMIASSSSFQANHVQTSSASSCNSRVKFPEGGEETFTKSFGSFFLIQCVEQRCMQPSSVILIPTLLEEKIFEGRELIWDAVGCPVPA